MGGRRWHAPNTSPPSAAPSRSRLTLIKPWSSPTWGWSALQGVPNAGALLSGLRSVPAHASRSPARLIARFARNRADSRRGAHTRSERPEGAHAWMWAIATARQVCWAADSEQAQSRVAWPRARPGDRRDLDHAAVAWPGVAVISSPPAHALLPIVQGSSDVEATTGFRNPFESSTRAGGTSGRSGRRVLTADRSARASGRTPDTLGDPSRSSLTADEDRSGALSLARLSHCG